MRGAAGVTAALLLILRTGAARAADPGDPGSARAEARRILAERRFHESKPPQPLRPLLDALGRLVAPIGRAFARLARHVPIDARVFWTVVAAVVVGVSIVVVRSLARRRDRRLVPSRPGAAPEEARTSPATLEHAANAAEQAGDLELALRLRFRAGVLRLQRARAVPESGILTSRELSRRLHSREFDRAAQVFDEVVYGRRPAQPVDVAMSRDDWQQVLRTAGAA